MADRTPLPVNEAPADSDDRGRLMRRATMAAVVVALTLIAAKLTAWLVTGSVALLSTLVDSSLDAFASILNLIAIRQALQPADREHRFGHGKAEPLAGLGQSAFIGGSALFLIGESVRRLLEPQPVGHETTGIAVMAFSIVMTLALVLVQRRVVARTGSVAVTADFMHYSGDLLMNVGVIIALLLGPVLNWPYTDPLFAIAIAGWLLWSAGRVSIASLNLLMDREFAEDERRQIKELCLAHGEVRNVHDLRTRSSGHQSFIQLHLEMAPDITLRHAHEISDAVEATIRQAFPNADVIIHEDPAGVPEARPVFR